MGSRNTTVSALASIGSSVARYGLSTALVWIGVLKVKDYEVQNIEILVAQSPITSRLRKRLGAQNFARLVGAFQVASGTLIAAKALAPRASAVGSFAAVGFCIGTLSFLATTPEAWQEGQGMPLLSMLGENLLKDGVLLGASLFTAAESLQSARAATRSSCAP